MKYVIYPEQSITDISNAIREKKGVNKNYKVSEMPAAIRSIANNNNSNNEKNHVMTFDMFNDFSGMDCYSYSDENNNIYFHDNNQITIFISEQHFKEINEYYSAGYRVEIVTPVPTSNNYPNTCKFTVNNVFENLYDRGQSDYGRYSGAAITISCYDFVYENYYVDTVDDYPSISGSMFLSYILRYNITSYDNTYYYREE